MSGLARQLDAAQVLDPERTARALGRCFEAWQRPGSPWLAELIERQSIYSPAALAHDLELGLREWTEAAVLAWLARERRPPCLGPELSAVFIAGSIPTNVFSLVSAPLLAGSAVWAHPPQSDRHTLELFVASLREQDPEVAAALAIGDAHGVPPQADAVIAEGRDATLLELRAKLAPEKLFIGYGHKLSLAAVGRHAPLDTAVRQVALDVAAFDGRGCLSPAYVIVEDSPPGRALRFAEALAARLEELERERPRGSLSAVEHIALQDLRARWGTRAGACIVLAPHGTDWAVAQLPFEGDLPPAGTLRHVPVIPVSGASALLHAVSICTPVLSALAHAGWDLAASQLARTALRAGGSRLCPLGKLQQPPIGWRHDGRGAIEVLLRFIDVEPGGA